MTDRHSLQRQIHVACRELGLDADTRQAMQNEVTGKGSMKDMGVSELLLVVNHLKAKGYKPKRGKRHPLASRADLRLIHVLWGLLRKGGVLDSPDRSGLNAFIRAQFGNAWGSVPADVDMLRDAKKINAVVRALKAMCERNGIKHDR